MKVENLADNRKAKLKFFAVYVLSVVLIIAITASLLQTNAVSAEATDPVEEEPQTSQVQQADNILHSKLKELDNLYTSLVNNSNKTNEYLPLVQASELGFRQTLDSLTGVMRNMNNEEEVQKLNNLLANFRNELQSRNTLYNSYVQAQTAKPATAAGANPAELQQLKAAIEEKNRFIASLQNSLREKAQPVVQNTTLPSADLQNKLAKANSANQKLQSQINAMKQSYQTVVEDNRRLLTQLQSARKQ